MKSKFKMVSFFIPLILLIFTGLLISSLLYIKSDFTSIYGGLFVIFMGFIVSFLSFLEIKNKIIAIEFSDNQLKISKYFGIGKTKFIDDKIIDGYKNSIIHTRNGSYENIYLLMNNKNVLKFSNQYYKNYNELKAEIQKKYKYLGHKNSNFITELKNFFNQ
jgi:hypothetical protein